LTIRTLSDGASLRRLPGARAGKKNIFFEVGGDAGGRAFLFLKIRISCAEIWKQGRRRKGKIKKAFNPKD
jgi:hypothetical protein